jgi:leucyl-tRNA synthetase
MSLYTIYPILKTIPLEYINQELFDSVFLEKPIPDSLKPIENLIIKMQSSFQYWYPMDIRVSGKDLIQNHFIMCLYNHIAIFPKKYWPKSFRTNGHITINQVKMSKSKGNFIIGKQLFNNYGVDTTRLALAYGSPDPIVDSNFEGKKKTEDGMPSLDMANASFSKLYEMYNWVDEVFQNFSDYRTTPLNFFDQLFMEQITTNTIEAVNQMDNHVHSEAVMQSFNHMLTNRNTYLQYTKNDPHQEVIKYFLESFSRYNVPFIPYMCEYIHYNMNTKLLGNPTPSSVRQLTYPPLPETRYPDALHKFMFIDNTTTAINKQLKTWHKKNPKQHPKMINIVMGTKMEDWQLHTMTIVDKMLETISPDQVLKTSAPVLNKDEKLQEFISTLNLNFKKKVQPFVSIYVKFNDMFKFDRTKTLQELQPFLKNYFQTDITITQDEAVDPMKPVIQIE